MEPIRGLWFAVCSTCGASCSVVDQTWSLVHEEDGSHALIQKEG